MDPMVKALLFAAIGGAVPAAFSSLQTCGADPMVLVTQCLAGAIVAVGSLYVKPPTTKEEPPPDPGPQG
jgi:hypothetical protein